VNKILLLDSNSLINRAFYAIPPMTTREGVFTNAVFGFMNMLARLVADHAPTHIAAVFDLKAPTFRHKFYAPYKATRKGMPDDLASQLPILKGLLQEMGVKILSLEGYEADDIIGTISKRFSGETLIVSADRDVFQLISPNVSILNTKRGVTDVKKYDLPTLWEEGFTPEKIIEFKALAGDMSDNIPGVLGVGEKTALNLLNEYENLDNIYANLNCIKGKLNEKLAQGKELAYISKHLATIDVNAPIECCIEDLEFKNAMPTSFFETLIRLEFKSLLNRFKKAEGSAEPLQVLAKEVKIVKITQSEKLSEILSGNFEKIALNFDKSVSFALCSGTEYQIEISENLFGEGINYDEIIDIFKPVLQNESVTKLCFDVKNLKHHLSDYNVNLSLPYDDLRLKAYLADSLKTYKSLADLIETFGFNQPASALFSLNDVYDEKLNQGSLKNLYQNLELKLVEVLFETERAGFKIDLDVLNELNDKYTNELSSLTATIHAVAGEVFNINSTKQLGCVLYEKLNLAKGKKLKTGYSVAADTLEELEHPIIEHLLRYRQLAKLQSTYVAGMLSVMNKATGYVNTVFNQCQTATGRLSSTEPNLQNIPVRTQEGREIRRMFVASDGCCLVTADYSQIELRLLAHFSNDEALIEAFKQNKDIHLITAAKIYNVSENQVTNEMRYAAKAVNFGIIYGMSAYGLANAIGTSPAKAKLFLDIYFDTYKKVKEYMQFNINFAHQNGYIQTLKGRVRHFPELRSPNHNIRSFGERAAMNMPLQGSAADIIKVAMLNVYRALKAGGYKSKLILQVHDELIIDTHLSEVEQVKKLLKECMEDAVELNVPLVADVKAGSNWHEVE
jgi:DNA polymerase-1